MYMYTYVIPLILIYHYIWGLPGDSGGKDILSIFQFFNIIQNILMIEKYALM